MCAPHVDICAPAHVDICAPVSTHIDVVPTHAHAATVGYVGGWTSTWVPPLRLSGRQMRRMRRAGYGYGYGYPGYYW